MSILLEELYLTLVNTYCNLQNIKQLAILVLIPDLNFMRNFMECNMKKNKCIITFLVGLKPSVITQ